MYTYFIFVSQLVACVAVCASLAAAMLQTYQAQAVLTPESRELGAQEKLVSATIDLLPEIADVFERMQSESPIQPQRNMNVVLDFMPLVRKVMQVQAEVEDKSLPEEVVHQINAVEVLIPHVNTFLEKLRQMDYRVKFEPQFINFGQA